MKHSAKSATVIAMFSTLLFQLPTAQAVTKIGAACKQINATSSFGGVPVKCVKSGKRLIWQKSPVAKPPARSKTPASTPTPTPASTSTEPVALPTGFSDLEANRKGISKAAWSKVNEATSKNSSKVGKLEIYTGPKTKPFFDDYPKALALVSKIFTNKREASSNLVIRYNFQDLAWAESKISEILPTAEVAQLNRNENGRLLSSNCRSSNCEGSKQVMTSTGVNVILQGVPNSYNPNDLAGKDRFFSGMLEAHEYFHSLQRMPALNKPLEQQDYPPVWFVEGSAEWVQNAAINSNNYSKYVEYFKLDCQSACRQLTKKDITKILTEATNVIWPEGFEYWLNYSFGSVVIESLVSISSPDSIISMYEELATKVGFEKAFKNVYGVEWKEAIPILASAIYANLQEG